MYYADFLIKILVIICKLTIYMLIDHSQLTKSKLNEEKLNVRKINAIYFLTFRGNFFFSDILNLNSFYQYCMYLITNNLFTLIQPLHAILSTV